MDQTNGGQQTAGLLSAFSSLTTAFSNSNAESSASDFKSKQLALSAETANLQSKSTLAAGQRQASLESVKVGQQLGQEKASYAGQGVAVSNGSAEAVQSSSAVQGAFAEQTIQSNAWREAWGFDIQASNDLSESAMTKLEGQQQSNNTMLTGGMNALTDISKGFTPKE